MKSAQFRSASGLRPASAFLFVTVVLAMVAAKSVAFGVIEEHEQPSAKAVHEPPRPDFDLVDREGRVLARSVERMDLVMSPRAMWQAHTPRRIADKLAEALGPACGGPDALLAAMMPDARGGVIRACGSLFAMDRDAALRVRDWYVANDVDGFEVVSSTKGDAYDLLWAPEDALSEAVRARHAGEMGPPSPTTWGRALADGLARCLVPEGELADPTDDVALRKQRRRVWTGLMHAADTVAFEGIDPSRVDDVIAVLDEEKVAGHQMRVDFQHVRTYPVREEEAGQDAFEILGDWRYVQVARARELTALEWAERERIDDPAEERRAFEREVRRTLDRLHPVRGLERIGAKLFEHDPWRALRPACASYEYERMTPARGDGKRYYLNDRLEETTPSIVTTIDSRLQAYTREVLLEVVENHEPAVTMAIVVDVESGEVLAVDAVSKRPSAEFLPLYHEYTPGSTFKVLVMASALDANVVTPDEEFDTHNGTFWFPKRNRPIREAEGHQTGWLSASYGLAHSVNAILVQIGTRVPDAFLHDRLMKLGYDTAPEVGLGRERSGHVTDLPWKLPYTHVSVCFGHEVGVTLWQHAAGLATVLRGGEHRDLTLLRGVTVGDDAYPIANERKGRVFREDTCETVRGMMRLGAMEGTGDKLYAAVEESGAPLWFGSKTGTTEKESGVVCVHLEQERNHHNRRFKKDDPEFIPFTALKGLAKPHKRSCYVSSICVFGRVEGTDREVMVYLVADEALKNGKYGSRIAGPAAMKLLHEALGLTRNGVPTWVPAERRGGESYDVMHNQLERPWTDRPELVEAAWHEEVGE